MEVNRANKKAELRQRELGPEGLPRKFPKEKRIGGKIHPIIGPGEILRGGELPEKMNREDTREKKSKRETNERCSGKRPIKERRG